MGSCRWQFTPHRIVTGFATGLAACVPAFILPSAMLKLPAVIAHRKTVEN